MKFSKGDDYPKTDESHPIFGISHPQHENVIEVYDDEELRDRILKLLQAEELIHGSAE